MVFKERHEPIGDVERASGKGVHYLPAGMDGCLNAVDHIVSRICRRAKLIAVPASLKFVV